MHKTFLITGAALGALGVVLGAFGAHSLKQYVAQESINTFETGVRYHMYHAFALIIAAILFKEYPGTWMKYAGIFFIIGIILFSGSLYIMTYLKTTNEIGVSKLGIVTPFGGLFFILGWIFVAVGVMKGV